MSAATRSAWVIPIFSCPSQHVFHFWPSWLWEEGHNWTLWIRLIRFALSTNLSVNLFWNKISVYGWYRNYNFIKLTPHLNSVLFCSFTSKTAHETDYLSYSCLVSVFTRLCPRVIWTDGTSCKTEQMEISWIKGVSLQHHCYTGRIFLLYTVTFLTKEFVLVRVHNYKS